MLERCGQDPSVDRTGSRTVRKRETIGTIFTALALSVLAEPVFAQDTGVTERGHAAAPSPEGAVAYDSIDSGLGRLIGNLYDEFWPDAQRRLHRHG